MARIRPFNIHVDVKVNLRTADVIAGGRAYTHKVAGAMAKRVKEVAQRKVSPGVGPGPHPHRTDHGWPDWVDTGRLRDSIDSVVITGRPDVAHAAVYSNLEYDRPYNVALEFGWHGPSGQFYRYPYLWPSAEQVVGEFKDIAVQHQAALAGGLAAWAAAVGLTIGWAAQQLKDISKDRETKGGTRR